MQYLYSSCACVSFFFKQKTAYEMRISDWSSDVCSSDLQHIVEVRDDIIGVVQVRIDAAVGEYDAGHAADGEHEDEVERPDHRGLEAHRTAPHGGDQIGRAHV